MTAPLTTVGYRIQSVDFLTYLELPLNVVNTSIEMRPFKETSKQQVGFLDRINLVMMI
jgi:hypothetical protein